MTVRSRPRPAASAARAETTDELRTKATPNTPAWRRWRLGRGLTQYDTEAGPHAHEPVPAGAPRASPRRRSRPGP